MSNELHEHHLSDQLRHSQELFILLGFPPKVIEVVGVGLEQELLELCNLPQDTGL